MDVVPVRDEAAPDVRRIERRTDEAGSRLPSWLMALKRWVMQLAPAAIAPFAVS